MISAQKYLGAGIKTILAEKGLDGNSRYWRDKIKQVSSGDVEQALAGPAGGYSFDRLLALVSPAAENYLEQMAQAAQQLTIRRFGRTIRLYAPLYLSNYCVNSCLYCGFNRTSKFKRTRLSAEEALKEADVIAAEGFRDILLVSSEDKDFITLDYLVELTSKLRDKFSSISVEIYQLGSEGYAKLFGAGIDGVTIYQETYDRVAYAHFHPAGPKADYDNRLRTAETAAQAGMREVGIGALLGLTNWRVETLALGEHAYYLMKRYWQSHISFSFPRLRPAYKVASMQFEHLLSDTNLAQMIMALRLCFADAGLVLSTREGADLRNHFIKLGITKLSAGSKTSPGGYSGRSRAVEQFQIDDNRSAAEVAAMIRRQGFEPVWKDWQRTHY